MATNYRGDGKKQFLAVPATAASAGAPVEVGEGVTGVTLIDRTSGGSATVFLDRGIFEIPCLAKNDAGNSAIAVGDQLYITMACTPQVSKKQAGNFFGFALQTVTSGATDTIEVLHETGLGPGSADISAGAINTADIAADAVTPAKINVLNDTTVTGTATGEILVSSGTDINQVAMSGDATIDKTGAITIAAGAVETSMIAADAIDGTLITDDAISLEHLDSGITPSHRTFAAGEHTMSTNATGTDIAVTSGSSGDLAICTLHTSNGTGATLVRGEMTGATLHVEWSASAKNCVVTYLVLRTAA